MNKIYFLIIIFLNKIILKFWFLSLLFHLHFLCLFASLRQTHTTPSTKTKPHSSVTTKISQKKTHIPEPPPPSPEQPTTNPSEKQSHTHTSTTDSTPPPPPNPATTESTQRTKPQTHGQTNFSNLRPTPPQSYPLLKSQTKYQTHGKEKNEGSLSGKIKENKLGFGDEI